MGQVTTKKQKHQRSSNVKLRNSTNVVSVITKELKFNRKLHPLLNLYEIHYVVAWFRIICVCVCGCVCVCEQAA